MIELIHKLFITLNEYDILYCHWKSNIYLKEMLQGKTDIDLLVAREDVSSFEEILASMRFKRAIVRNGLTFPSVFHYYGLDGETGKIVHVHVYYRIITGESLLKNYHLPLEEMLFQNLKKEGVVKIPDKGAELVLFILRTYLKQAFVGDLVLMARESENIKRELVWLLDGDSEVHALNLLEKWLPWVDAKLFTDCVRALQIGSSSWQRYMLGLRIRVSLRGYARHSPFWREILLYSRSLQMLGQRIAGQKSRKKVLSSKGKVIAIVGPDASGKSTLVSELEDWLSEDLDVVALHAGKPPSSWITFIPNLFIPLLREVVPRYRTSSIDASKARAKSGNEDSASVGQPLIYALRALLLARDRRKLLMAAHHKAANGTVVLCDRYPSSTIGAMDSPRLEYSPSTTGNSSLSSSILPLERKLYEQIPPSDIVIQLTVPVNLAVMRNEERIKEGKEPEESVRLRHAESTKMIFEKTRVHKISTDQPIEKTILAAKKVIWEDL